MRYGYIYITTNTVNGDRYLGKHKAQKKSNEYCGSGSEIKRQLKKFGRKNFTHRIVEWVEGDKKELRLAEGKWATKLGNVWEKDNGWMNKAHPLNESENFTSTPESQAKAVATRMRNGSYAQTPASMAKKKATMMERYGTLKTVTTEGLAKGLATRKRHGTLNNAAKGWVTRRKNKQLKEEEK